MKAVRILNDVIGIQSGFSNLDRLELRYISAFTQKHGLERPSEFLSNDLSMPIPIPEKLKASKLEGADYNPHVEISFPLHDDARNIFLMKAAPGTKQEQPALILDLRVQRDLSESEYASSDPITDWLNQAHCAIHNAFQSIISDELRNRMGPVRQLETQDVTGD